MSTEPNVVCVSKRIKITETYIIEQKKITDLDTHSILNIVNINQMGVLCFLLKLLVQKQKATGMESHCGRKMHMYSHTHTHTHTLPTLTH